MTDTVRVAAVHGRLAFLLGLASACAGSSNDAETESTSTTVSESDDPACGCISEPFPGGALVAPTCGALLCETRAYCQAGGFSLDCLRQSPVMHDEATMTCAMDALAMRTPGYIEWSVGFFGVNAYEAGYVVILDDGMAITQSTGFNDATVEYRGGVLGQLRTPQQFEDCAAQVSLADRFACLIAPTVEPRVVCDASWQ